jgi:hypothetical protein
MTERQATFCGYALAVALTLLICAIITVVNLELKGPEQEKPVVVTSWVDTVNHPQMLYVLAHIKPGYRIYPTVVNEPSPLGAELHLDANPSFTGVGEWINFISPGVSDTVSIVLWGLRLEGDAELYHLTGTLRITVYNDEACQPPEYIEFEATP